MSNTSLGRAKKGSKFWMQTIINSEMKSRLNSLIGDPGIEWLSPLRAENYKEYKLNEPGIAKIFGGNDVNFSFWPNNQPQWDAIGKSGNTIYLVEAKAHTKEVESKISASSNKSVQTITDSLSQTFKHFGGGGNFSAWTKKYYQFANRLAFYKFLNSTGLATDSEDGFDVRLVFLNIVDDPTHKSTSQDQWNQASKALYEEMFGNQNSNILPSEIQAIYFQV